MAKRLNIKIEDDTHAALTLMADVRETSVQALVESIITEGIAEARNDKEFQEAARERLERQRAAFGL